MATPQQIELAKKYWYTQDQINQELATPWTVKRVDALGTPTYEQPVNGQYASAGTTRTQDVGQISTWVNAGGETLYNFGTPAPTSMPIPQVPWVDYSKDPRGTMPLPPNTAQPIGTNQPVPWSASSIFWPENTFENQYYKNLNDQYNTPIDEEAIRRQKQADYQAQLDSVKAIYADQLNQARVRGQGRQGSSSAIQARRWLLGSNVGEAMTNNIETLNVQEQDLVRQEEANAIAAIQGLIRSWANEEIAARKKAIKEGGESLLAYYSGAGDRKAKKTSDAAKKLLALGKDPSAISDADLATAGIDKNDLLAEYNTLKASQKAAADKVKADALKTQLDNEKTMAETGKLYTDANMPREIGGYIYDAQWNPIGTKYEKPDKPEYLKYEWENPDGSKYSYYVNPATGQKVDPIKTFGADVGYKVDINAILGGYSPKGQELLSVPDGTVIPTRLGQVSSQNASVRWKECAEYVNDIAGTKMGNTYASKTAVCNEPTGWVGSVVAWKPNGSGAYGHTGIIVWEDANNYFVKSSNYVPGTVTTEKVPKGNIKNFYTPDSVKNAQTQQPAEWKAVRYDNGNVRTASGILYDKKEVATTNQQLVSNESYKALKASEAFNREWQAYKWLIDKYGIEMMPGKAKQEMAAAYERVMRQAQTFFNLWVLQKLDEDAVKRMIPNTARDIVGSKYLNPFERSGVAGQVKQVEDMIKSKIKGEYDSLNTIYGDYWDTLSGLVDVKRIYGANSDEGIINQY